MSINVKCRGLSGKWESVKDSTDIEKGSGIFKEIMLTTTKKVVLKREREGMLEDDLQ